jgi:hypothetical protein
MNDTEDTIVLFRPVDEKELALIRESGNRAFPPRLPEQPIFYPVVQEDYAVQIAVGDRGLVFARQGRPGPGASHHRQKLA